MNDKFQAIAPIVRLDIDGKSYEGVVTLAAQSYIEDLFDKGLIEILSLYAESSNAFKLKINQLQIILRSVFRDVLTNEQIDAFIFHHRAVAAAKAIEILVKPFEDAEKGAGEAAGKK